MTLSSMDNQVKDSSKETLCKRCSAEPAIFKARMEPMCKSCFQAFVVTKNFKQMHPFRFKAEASIKTLLVPISFGPSSLALVQLVSHDLELRFAKTKRRGYRLHILHVDCSLNDENVGSGAAKMKQLESLYPEHLYSIISIRSVFEEPRKSNGVVNGATQGTDSRDRFEKLFNSIPTATSRSDVFSILLTRCIVNFAKSHSCDCILWGDNATRLAERVMSETSKGRGYSIPWQVNDGETPHGVSFNFPNRDMYKKEIVAYLDIANSTLAALVEEPTTSIRVQHLPASSGTIDMLLKHYFETAEESHPGLLSNVVKTSNKLQPTAVGMQRCKLCEMPVTKDQLGIDNWKGIQIVDGEGEKKAYGLCYGCSRSVPQEAVALLP